MKVRIITPLAGHGFTHNAGDVVEMDDKEAGRLIAAGIATPVKSSKSKTEKATTPDVIDLEVTTDPNA